MRRAFDSCAKWFWPVTLTAFGAYAAYHLLYWLGNPWQNEYREGIVLPVGEAFLKGGNPFDGVTPVANLGFVYGFLASLAVASVEWLLGVGSRLIDNRLLSVGSVLVTAAFVEMEAQRLSRGKVPRFLAFAIMLSGGWVLCEVDARADHLAMLLSFGAVVVVARGVGWWRVGLASILTIAAFYTKQYLVLVGVPVFAYLLTVDWRKALGYGVLSGVLMLGTAVVVNRWMPLYFTMAIFCTGGIGTSSSYMLLQSAIFGWFYWPLLLVVARQPRPGDARPYAIAAVSGALFLTAWLGGNGGAILSYYSQLLLPFVVLWAAKAFSEMSFGRVLGVVLALGTGLFSVWHFGPYRTSSFGGSADEFGLRLGAFAFTPTLTEGETAEWRRLANALDELAPADVFTATPAVCSLAFARGMTHYEAGHGFRWCLENVCEHPSDFVRRASFLTRGADAAFARWRRFDADTRLRIDRGTFKALVVEPDFKVPDAYRQADEFVLRTGLQRTRVGLYLRR